MRLSKKSLACKQSPLAWHETFVAMAPAIETHAKLAFRGLRGEAREEAVQEVVCNACAAFARLVELNKTELAYPTALARFGVAQTRAGRKVGGRLNIRDISSPYCQREKGIQIERLDRFDQQQEAWLEVLVEDRRAGPAEVAATRLDFSAWLRRLPGRLRQIARFWPAAKAPRRRPSGSAYHREESARSAGSCITPGSGSRATNRPAPPLASDGTGVGGILLFLAAGTVHSSARGHPAKKGHGREAWIVFGRFMLAGYAPT